MPRLLSLLAAVGLAARRALADCESYGMDFQNHGQYFQNISSSDPFTFAQQFSGCEQDESFNILVDPNGDQYECSKTPLRPDDTTQTSTCPNLKNTLWSGDWSIIVMSNNGHYGAPVAYERDFSLVVGVPETVTATPTVTISSIIYPTLNITTTTAITTTTTLPPVTTTVPKITIQRTKTVTPPPVWTTKSINLATITVPKFSVTVRKTVKTATASCHLPSRQPYPDPFIHIWPAMPKAQSIVISAASAAGSAVPTATAPSGSAKFRYVRDPLLALEENREKWLQERSERLRNAEPIVRRAPDASIVTSTIQETSRFVTATAYVTTTTLTNTVIATNTITSTNTPPPVTVMSGKTYLPPQTITLPTQTKTRTIYGIAKVTTTRVQTVSITVTTTISPAASKTACRQKGGFYY
ncbi:hypothetical protein B0J12DRAFT_198231 [Macrophomina phaseolina]|uniref:Uncharacterized protein n=1 Tax=Macrophomina phaseolina TaxID=35725 RepID=A0ABQ8G5Z8_9PEZI|nr:hypothetical protein B0J12DRAFT_198231 [Macrophomina phaseolina]